MALLAEFRVKVEQAINLVPQMDTEETYDAVECWNLFSEKLQEIVHRSMEFAEIEAIALSMEEPGHATNKTDCILIDFNVKTTTSNACRVQDVEEKEVKNSYVAEEPASATEPPNSNGLMDDVDVLVNCTEVSELDCLEQCSENADTFEMRLASRSRTDAESAKNEKDQSLSERERNLECSVCCKPFKQRKSLKVHMRRHTGVRPYKCLVCGKTFTQSGTLLSHRAVHSDARPFACGQCGRAFRQRSQLRTHQLRHENVKRHQCRTCQFKFLTRGDLMRHEKTHTGERLYRCELCDKSYARRQSLELHLRKRCGLTTIDLDQLLKATHPPLSPA